MPLQLLQLTRDVKKSKMATSVFVIFTRGFFDIEIRLCPTAIKWQLLLLSIKSNVLIKLCKPSVLWAQSVSLFFSTQKYQTNIRLVSEWISLFNDYIVSVLFLMLASRIIRCTCPSLNSSKQITHAKPATEQDWMLNVRFSIVLTVSTPLPSSAYFLDSIFETASKAILAKEDYNKSWKYL